MQSPGIAIRNTLKGLLGTGFCLFFWIFGFSQSSWETDYAPLLTESARLDSIFSQMKTSHESRLAQIDSRREKSLYEAWEEQLGSVQEKVENGYVLSDPRFDRYLDKILQNILDKNPGLPPSEIRVLLARYPWPNAVSMGEGTLLLNIGLIPHLENESQLAFVICHEIAHYVLNHADDALRKRLAVLESKTTQKQIKQISRTDYGARAKAVELIRELSYDSRRHSRTFEAQADSMALELLIRSPYDARETLACLAILDNIDEEKAVNIDIAARFDSKEIPFNPEWLKVEQSVFGQADIKREFDKDSLKTHPDCAHRIQLLAPRLEKYSETGKSLNPQGEVTFATFSTTCEFELGRSDLFMGNLDRCLYHALRLLEKYPENDYLIGLTGICLNKMYLAQKDHELGKYVQLPDESYAKDYNLVLNFIQNIPLSALKQLGRAFLKNRVREPKSEYLLFAWWESCKIAEDGDGVNKSATRYLNLYPQGDFAEAIKSE